MGVRVDMPALHSADVLNWDKEAHGYAAPHPGLHEPSIEVNTEGLERSGDLPRAT